MKNEKYVELFIFSLNKAFSLFAGLQDGLNNSAYIVD